METLKHSNELVGKVDKNDVTEKRSLFPEHFQVDFTLRCYEPDKEIYSKLTNHDD
ncbi:unnamed protein product [Sphenostylis stenocarpa]|uniref:Uncharacterized protein n=1 Tax=Sphenostylis stenocarpa TaxID=92480 RepID=A0AA86S7D4_9FABA|nr:unnamed protein product [Sphenostylis stenocarpa]